MGMDLLELNIEIGNEFGVDLEIDFWRKAKTFGDVLDEVVRRLEERPIQAPHEDRVEYPEVLAELTETFQTFVPGCKEITENTRLTQIIPYWRRTKVWNQLRERFPMLTSLDSWRNKRALGIYGLATLSSIVIFVSMVAAIFLGKNPFFLFFSGALIVIGFLALIAALPMFVLSFILFPYKNVGDMARAVAVKRSRLKLLSQGDVGTVEIMLREIFCRVLAVEPEKVTRDALLVKDLGVE